MADRRTVAHQSYRVGTRRQSLRLALLVVRKEMHLGAYLNRIVKSDNAEHFLRSVDILYAMMPRQMTM